MVRCVIFFWNVVVCLGQQGPNILGSPVYPSITSVLTTLETYGISLDLVLWSVLASGRRWLGVFVYACVYTEYVVLCVWVNSSGYSTARSIARFMVDGHQFFV